MSSVGSENERKSGAGGSSDKMRRSEYISRIREYLHDPDGKVWSDAELSDMISAAARAYSADTGIYRASSPLAADDDGVCALPENYISFVAGWNRNGEPVEPTTVDDLAWRYGNFSDLRGEVRYVCEDTESLGRIRVCPRPEDGHGTEVYALAYPYGTVLRACYGIPIHDRDYGIPTVIRRFAACGTAVYVRNEQPENIRDHLAVIFHAAYQAYTMDSDFQDTEKGALYYGQYRRRVSRIGRYFYDSPRVRGGVKFF